MHKLRIRETISTITLNQFILIHHFINIKFLFIVKLRDFQEIEINFRAFSKIALSRRVLFLMIFVHTKIYSFE